MTAVIRNGTIVTADLNCKADVLIENGRIATIGHGLTGDTTRDATGCLVMPGGIDPHTLLEMPIMGTCPADDFDSGTRAATRRGRRSMSFTPPARTRTRRAAAPGRPISGSGASR